jgi:hypothetical protein
MADFITSKIDQRLARFNNNRPKTASELSEISKHKKIAELRDNAVDTAPTQEDEQWQDF